MSGLRMFIHRLDVSRSRLSMNAWTWGIEALVCSIGPFEGAREVRTDGDMSRMRPGGGAAALEGLSASFLLPFFAVALSVPLLGTRECS